MAINTWGAVNSWVVGTDDLLADDISSASSVSTPSIGQVHVLSANGLQSVSSVSSPSLGQVHVLLADDIYSATTISSPGENTTWEVVPPVVTIWQAQTTTDTTWTIQ